MYLQGMVDPGDSVPNTLKKEFGEEALDSIEASDEVKKKISEHIDQLFKEGQEVSFKLHLSQIWYAN